MTPVDVIKSKHPCYTAIRPIVTDELLEDIANRIVEAFHPDEIILFGSYAYGIPYADSDVDLLVVMDSAKPVVERIRDVAGVAETPFLPMDVLVYTPQELDRRVTLGDSFVNDILCRGRVLYSSGPRR
jgi:predicted nucleotidyltransferase